MQICISCDENVHQYLPLHNRITYVQGWTQPLLPTEGLNENNEVIVKSKKKSFCTYAIDYCSCNSNVFLLVSTLMHGEELILWV